VIGGVTCAKPEEHDLFRDSQGVSLSLRRDNAKAAQDAPICGAPLHQRREIRYADE